MRKDQLNCGCCSLGNTSDFWEANRYINFSLFGSAGDRLVFPKCEFLLNVHHSSKNPRSEAGQMPGHTLVALFFTRSPDELRLTVKHSRWNLLYMLILGSTGRYWAPSVLDVNELGMNEWRDGPGAQLGGSFERKEENRGRREKPHDLLEAINCPHLAACYGGGRGECRGRKWAGTLHGEGIRKLGTVGGWPLNDVLTSMA